ncbi:S8 family peptidase [Epilithonimonas mollis]|uniref:Por secretion system C-terminal sorting domain-containing protein n=1 Tax=Epilithonimonas mollis TaxID=216903 RepID=A0A1M6P4Q1_9FLAO|nr:S8 family peptidase [Epilithonimonas mollis]SHK02908.1 Por secretion system C-terminal sorting domain-containing protein [Epilithonimonas mollis]
MKRILFSAGLLFSFYFSNAQDLKLKNEFTKQRLENEKKLDAYFQNNAGRYSSKAADSLKRNLAGFAGRIPLFYSTEDTGANASSNIDELQNGTVSGIASPVTGSGITITTFDSGLVMANHEQFATTRAANKEDTSLQSLSVSFHTTNVNSVLIGNGLASGTFNQSGNTYQKSRSKGVLPAAKVDNYMFAKTLPIGNQYEKLAALPNLNISNHSYGINSGWSKPNSTNTYYWYGNYDLNHQDTYAGAYGEQDYNFDKIVYARPEQIIVKSTGNYYGVGPDANSVKYRYNTTTEAWDLFGPNDDVPPANCSQMNNCVYFGSLAKNIITVGAVNQLTTANQKYTQASDVVKGSFSSAGPRKDGAVKPDLAAVGVDMIMANYITSQPNTSNYAVNFGTSYAAPIVSAVAGAITQIERSISGNNNFIFRADEMKALLTHTANEAGRPGPDVWYGWGLVDAKKAAQVLVNKINEDAYFYKNDLQSGVKYTKEIKAKGNEPLKVSISWVDPAIDYFTTDIDLQQNHTSRLVNDLDLRVVEISSGTTYYPWKLDISDPNANAAKGDNTVDNVEQIVVDNPVAEGIYRIEVTNKNSLVDQDGNAASQSFALVATGTKKITLASNENSNDGIKIFPAKTKDIVNVNFQNEAERIAVFDMNGKLIFEKTNQDKSQKINFGAFPTGVYMIIVKTKTGMVAKKIIKE